MDISEITKLAKLMQDTGLTAIEIEENEVKVRLERSAVSQAVVEAPALESPFPAVFNANNAFTNGGRQFDASTTSESAVGNEILSPTVGVFYASSSPDSEPYVQVGSTVKEGDVLCIIEAMKLMNEITAETGGTITEICAENEQVVEFNQPLFRIV